MVIKRILIFLIVLLLNTVNIYALNFDDFPKDELFHVIAVESDSFNLLASFNTYQEADKYYESNKENYNNLSVFSNGRFYNVEYGIVIFTTSEKCDYNVEFVNVTDNESNYINGCYGKDGAYLETGKNGNKIKFRISGVDGWAKLEDVTIYPIHMLPGRLSKYKVIGGNLFHQIKHSFNNDYYGSIINLGSAPEYLNEGSEYYSYDGHYFYPDDSLWIMLDDYKKENFEQSINKDNPYYNYYQYISNRSLTSYDETYIDEYLKNVLNINSKIKAYKDYDRDSVNDNLSSSQFYNEIQAFFQYQYQYGANAMMMIALSANESALGRSSLAFTRNNLFGHSAFDSDVEKNASRYLNVSSSIYSHARYYISNSYCNPNKFQYHGCYFGNKASGMNVSYASDPYWGEKAAQNYYLLDSKFNNLDLHKYTIGIKTSNKAINIYQFPNNDEVVLYKTSKQADVSFVILEVFTNEFGNWYKIQSDAALNEKSLLGNELYYDFENDVAYIKQDSIDVILQGNDENSEKVLIKFDAGEGTFRDGSNLVSYKIEKNKKPSIENPVLENYLFTGWDKEVMAANNDETYTAQYKEVSDIKLISDVKTQYEIKDRIDLTNGEIQVNFVDGSNQIVKLDTNMVSNFDFKIAGDQEVIITYGGKTTSYMINVSEELDTIRNQIRDEINTVIEEFKDRISLNDDEIERVLALKAKIDNYMIPSINQSRIREIDKLIKLSLNKKINYILKDDKLDGGVSGLSLSILMEDSLNKKFFKDIIKIEFKQEISSKAKEALTSLALGNNFTVFDGFSVIGKKNNGELNLHGPILINIKKPDGALDNQLFSILHYKDGEVFSNYTTQTNNQLKFVTDSFGEFLIVAKNTTNTYQNDDIAENLTVLNSDRDIYELLTYALAPVTVMIMIIIFFKIRKKRLLKKQELIDD